MDTGSFQHTRVTLHRVAAHVLARRRSEVTGRFGLRASPGGIATPAFGEQVECIRIAGAVLVREVGGTTVFTPIPGSSLRALARFAGTDIDLPFSCGGDTPAVGDPDDPLEVDEEDVTTILAWYSEGWKIVDAVLSGLPESAAPATLQLWPEHFDAGTNVALDEGQRVNLGCSPGDTYEPEPYLYVGPWGPDRPGDPAYWNAPFGATLRASAIAASANPMEMGAQFMRRGLASFASSEPAQ